MKTINALLIIAMTLLLGFSIVFAVDLTPSSSTIEISKVYADKLKANNITNITARESGCNERICEYRIYNNEDELGSIVADYSPIDSTKILNRDAELKKFLEDWNPRTNATFTKTLEDGKITIVGK